MVAAGSSGSACSSYSSPRCSGSTDDKARGTKEADVGTGHVNAGEPVQYAVLPPTSGGHWSAPAAPVKAGVYDKAVPFEATTHNLEHGGIVIVYSPSLAAEDLAKLKDSVRSITAIDRTGNISHGNTCYHSRPLGLDDRIHVNIMSCQDPK